METKWKGNLKRPIEERFWEKVDIRSPEECWEWKAALFKTGGYGQIWHNNTMKRAHRVSWELANGFIPDGLDILHKCDNPRCVNPWHLLLGTRLENNLDKIRKGRMNRRERDASMRYKTKLTPTNISEIRKLASEHTPYRKIGEMFGISHASVGYIVRRVQWRHIK